MEYSTTIDWQISKTIKHELVKRYIDVTRLGISTTKGIVEIKGDMNFQVKADNEKEFAAVAEKIKKIDIALRHVAFVREIHWKLANMKKVGLHWVPIKGTTTGSHTHKHTTHI